MPVPETPRSAAPADAELIQRTLDGDGSAYGTLVDRYQRRIYRVAFAVLRDPMEADLATQDTFVQAYLNLGRFQHRANFETWLTRIAINRSRDSLRRRRWLPLWTRNNDGSEELLVEPAATGPDAERVVMSTQLQRAIDAAVETLSPQQRTIFCLRHFENLQLEEIAERMNLRAGTVRAHMFRAIHKVREQLAEWLPEYRHTEKIPS